MVGYIGRSPQIGGYHKLDAITTDGSASYTMQLNSGNFVPESANHLIVSVNGVIQAPTDSFTVSGSTITFASTLSVSDTIDFIMALGNTLDIGTPSDSTVSLSKLTATGTKDSTTFLRGDNTFAVPVGGENTPAFHIQNSSNQSISNTTMTQVTFNTELFDTDNCYDNVTNHRFTPTEAGKYFLYSQICYDINTGTGLIQVRILKNGSLFARSLQAHYYGNNRQTYSVSATVEANGSSDYFEIWTYQDSGSSRTLVGDTNDVWFGGYKLIGV